MDIPLSAVSPFLGAVFSVIGLTCLLLASVRHFMHHRKEALMFAWSTMAQILISLFGIRSTGQIGLYYFGIMVGWWDTSQGAVWLRDMIGYAMIVIAILSFVAIARVSMARQISYLELENLGKATEIIRLRAMLEVYEPAEPDNAAD